MGIDLYDSEFLELLVRGTFNLMVSFLIIKFCYLKQDNYNDNAFSFFVFSLIVFFICYLMGNVKLDIGLAFGLFAIFSILRYRTDSIPMREMTYLFVVMGISVINALSNHNVSYAELLFTNFAIFLFLFILEKYRIVTVEEEKVEKEKKLNKMEITHNDITHIKPIDHSKLLEDLKEITGVDIRYIKILKTDLVNREVQIIIYYP